MSKKALIFGLFVTLLASQVGDVFVTDARADYMPYGLYCTPSAQSVASGELVSFSAGYSYPAATDRALTWNAMGGSPSTGSGTYFSTRFYTNSINETRLVTVTDGYQTATCTAYVYGPTPTWTPSPTPTPYNLQCSPNVLNVASGGLVTFSVWGGNGTYYWSGADGIPSYGYGSSYSTRFSNPNPYAVSRTVTVTSGYQSATCAVTVYAGSTWTPTPTPYPYVDTNARIVLTQKGRNVTRGQSGEYTSVVARGGDTIDIVLRVRSTNGSYVYNAYVTETLPAGVVYINGSTTVNGYASANGIVSAGINVGTLSPTSDTVIKFSVRVDDAYVPTWGTVTVNSIAQARGDGLNTVSVSMPVTLGRNASIAAVSAVKTGPADSLWLALMAAFLVTGGYAVYTRSDVFGRRMAFAEVSRLSRSSGPNFLK